MAAYSITINVAWWVRLYLYALVVWCTLTGMAPNEERVLWWVGKGLSAKPITKRRAYLIRFACNYFGWRKHLGVRASLAAAWRVSRS